LEQDFFEFCINRARGVKFAFEQDHAVHPAFAHQGVLMCFDHVHELGCAFKGFDPRQSQVRMEGTRFLFKSQGGKPAVDLCLDGDGLVFAFCHAAPENPRLAGIGEDSQVPDPDGERMRFVRRFCHDIRDLVDHGFLNVAEEFEREMDAFRIDPIGPGGSELHALFQILDQLPQVFINLRGKF